jgi:hypothetical protein
MKFYFLPYEISDGYVWKFRRAGMKIQARSVSAKSAPFRAGISAVSRERMERRNRFLG